MLPVSQQQDGDRNRDREQSQEPDRLEQSTPEPSTGYVLDRAIVGPCLLRGGPVITLAVRDALTGLQGRGMSELRVVAHGRADVQHAGFADECIAADIDRTGMNEIRLGTVAQHDGILAEDRVCADGDEVGADWDNPTIDHDVRADPRTQQTQIYILD